MKKDDKEKGQDKYLTKKEREYCDALANFDTEKAAAEELGIAVGTLYNWKSRLKKRYKKERGHVNALLAQTRRGGNLANLLTERRKMSPPDSMTIEEEEDFE